MLKPRDDRRHPRADVMLAVSLACCAGATNAIALRAAGVFAASMTGNVSWMAEQLEAGAGRTAGFFAAVIALFIAGSFCCASATASGLRRKQAGVYAACLFGEALGIAASAFVHTPVLLCCALAFLMGWQNSLATTLTGARVRATHLSGICTDVGIELSSLWSSRGVAADAEASLRWHRIVLSSATIAAFFVGAFLGCVAFGRVAGLALVFVAAILSGIAASGYRTATRYQAGSP
jgi:uncharacterized membrane protein YoaK (UPF0700 family)